MEDIFFNNVEIEIYADNIYYIIYGPNLIIEKIADIYNKYYLEKKQNKKILILKLNYPIINLLDNLNEDVQYNEIHDIIQPLIYAECPDKIAKNMYTYIIYDNETNEISFPQLDIIENKDIEEIIYINIKDVNIPLAKYIKKNIKLVNFIGDNKESIIYKCKLSDTLKLE